MIKIAPRIGKVIIDPMTRRPLPPLGIELESLDSYWLRRLKDGDVLEVASQAQAEPAAQVETETPVPMAPARTRKPKKSEGV